jgi:putative molybdopterin biosynthesis protein
MSETPLNPATRRAAEQQQFLDVVSRDTATERFHEHLSLVPLGVETVDLANALDRVLANDVAAEVDVPAFDRSNVDGFAVHAADTFNAMEEAPRSLQLNDEVLAPGVQSKTTVEPGTATPIATGAIVPRGADAVVMIEQTELVDGKSELQVRRAVSPGQHIAFAGTDIARGETVLREGHRVTSREIGVLAAVGLGQVDVFRRPRVAIVSTGDEIIAPGETPRPGAVFDSNQAILSAAVRELGAEPVPMGIVPDDETRLRDVLQTALDCDVILLSGGTSKGAGDLSYHVVRELTNPGIVAHGVALKPGKPICLAVTEGKPVVILPGFPTSAIFTFHEFVAPVIRALGGQPEATRDTVTATMPLRFNSERGRTEFLLVGLVESESGLAAYPMGKGSGSVTTFSRADGFIAIDSQTEIVEAGASVEVQLLGRAVEPADLISIGSHCVGLDLLLGLLERRGLATKALHVGSTGGLAAAQRGECDLGGIHLMDLETGEYNRPFLTDGLELIAGYRRMQCLVFRSGDERFEGKTVAEALELAAADTDCRMVNRNAGSGTRILIDRLLDGRTPAGYPVQAKSHNAVAAAIQQGRADWGIAIETVAREYDLAAIPVQDEHYDFVVPTSRRERPAVRAFVELLSDPATRGQLEELGFRFHPGEPDVLTSG